MDMQADPLFAALTRPSVLFGVPAEAYGVILVGPLVLVLFTQHVLFAAPIPALYLIARILCARDPRAFRYYMLALQTKGVGLNRTLWHCSSYSPARFRKRPRNDD